MNIYPLNKTEMKFYDSILKQAKESKLFLKKNGVVGIGIGYKHCSGSMTDNVALTVRVKKKKSRDELKQADRIPMSFLGVPTDIIEVPEVRLESRTTPIGLIGTDERNRRYDSIIGGIAIRNQNLCHDNSGVLGAIVFCEKTGRPLGLSAQHNLGDLGKKKKSKCGCKVCKNSGSHLKPARIGDAINQPMTYNAEDQIGTLLDWNSDYDVALFRLSPPAERQVEPRVMGIKGELTEPLPEYFSMIGHEVECSATHVHTKGTIVEVQYPGRGRKLKEYTVKFHDNYARTKHGDSGALWVLAGQNRPVGVHTGSFFFAPKYDRETKTWKQNKNRYATVTCIHQVKKWYKFSFRPKKYAQLLDQTKKVNAAFVETSDGFLMFGTKPDQAAEIEVRKFDQNYDSVEFQKKNPQNGKSSKTKTTGNIPHSDLAVCHLSNRIILSSSQREISTGLGTTIAAWRSANSDLIQLASLKPDGSFDQPFTTEMKTRFKPALLARNGFLVMVYTDALTGNVDLATSLDGENWSEYTLASGKNDKACSAPTITEHNGAVVVAWRKEKDKLLKLIYVWPTSRSTSYMNGPKFQEKFQPIGDPALASGDGSLYLAFTTSTGQLQLLSASHDFQSSGMRWSEQVIGLPDSRYSPTLFYLSGQHASRQGPHFNGRNGRLICTRREDE